MGNSLIFPAPKCTYSTSSLQPFYHSIAVPEKLDLNNEDASKAAKRTIPSLFITSLVKKKYLMIYFHGNSVDIGRVFQCLLEYYENFQVAKLYSY